MKVRENLALVFFVFLILAILLSVTKFSSLYSFFSFLRPSYNLVSNLPFFDSGEIKRLKAENLVLVKKIADEQKLASENQALHDQFLASNPKNLNLLPSHVVGAPRFIPGVSLPETYTLDVGTKDGVKVGNAVIFKDNLVGRVEQTTSTLSQVILIVSPNFKFTAKTASGTLGIVKGEGNDDIIFDNVLLSDKLTASDLVVTSGDLRVDSSGLPSDLIIGRITSVEKAPSDIFQKGKLQSFLDLSKLQTVFVVTGIK